VGGAVLALVFASGLAASVEGCKPKPKKAFGEACGDDMECESLTCSPQGGICSKTCNYDKDCGGDLVCHATSESSGLCSKSIGAAPNGPCMNGDDCANGSCLHKVGEDSSPGICSKWCSSADDCPAGMKLCMSISDSGSLKFCLPGNDPAAKPNFGPPKTSTKGAKPGTTKPATTPPQATSKVPPPPVARPTPTATPTPTPTPAPPKPAGKK
jgi:hypothetical protein